MALLAGGRRFRTNGSQASAPFVDMEPYIFARFHSREARDEEVAALLRDQVAFVRNEPGCLAIGAYRPARDPRPFNIHSRWIDEAAFDAHAALANTLRFVGRIESFVDDPLEVTRSKSIC